MSIGIMSSYADALGTYASGGNTVGSDKQYGAWYNQLYQSRVKTPEINAADFDYKAKQAEVKKQLEQYEKGDQKIQTLKKDSADFLTQYTGSLTKTGEAAKAVQGGNLDKLLGDVSGGTISDENMKKTTDAMQKLVDSYNSTLKTLGDNAQRGAGVVRQLGRMEQAPTAQAAMEMVGVTRAKDGSLSFDKEKFSGAMKSAAKADAAVGSNARMDLLKGIVGGSSGIASGVRQDASSGMNLSANSLIGNDLANIQQQQQQNGMNLNNIYTRAGAQSMMNAGTIGLLMNLSA